LVETIRCTEEEKEEEAEEEEEEEEKGCSYTLCLCFDLGGAVNGENTR
jgi:hypothetical protein